MYASCGTAATIAMGKRSLDCAPRLSERELHNSRLYRFLGVREVVIISRQANQWLTGETSPLVVHDPVELFNSLVGCRQRIVRIPGVHGGMSEVQEERVAGVVAVDDIDSGLGEYLRRVASVKVPSRLEVPSHVQAPVWLRGNAQQNVQYKI